MIGAAASISAASVGVTLLLVWWSVREQARALEAARQHAGQMAFKIMSGNYDVDVSVFISHASDDHLTAAKLRKTLLYLDGFVGPQSIRARHRRSPTALRFCLDTFGYFIPREAREPFWNHLLEDRDEMLARGCRAWIVSLAMSSQIGWVIVAALKDFVVQLFAGMPKHQ